MSSENHIEAQISNLYRLARLARNTDALSPIEYGKQVDEILSNVSIPNVFSSSHTKKLFDIYTILVRLIENKEGLYPATRGYQLGQTLTVLRTLDGKRYDNEVISKIR